MGQSGEGRAGAAGLDADTDTEASGISKACKTVSRTTKNVKRPRRAGRPARPNQSKAEFVEWWKRGLAGLDSGSGAGGSFIGRQQE